MKKILILSDTHSHLDEQIIGHCEEADEIWHAGDIGTISVYDQLSRIKPVRAVWGNIDNDKLRITLDENNIFTCEKVKVLITHIAGSFGNYTPQVRDLLKIHRPQLFICGHSHVLKVQKDSMGFIYINPGAAGHHGFHQMRTMIRFQLQDGAVNNMDVIELGKRGRSS